MQQNPDAIMETDPEPPVLVTNGSNPPLAPTQKVPLFRQAKISIAVDVSGSTYGDVLTAETKAVREICGLFPPSLKSEIQILPWCHYAQDPLGLDELDELDADGDTDPNALLHDDACRYELQNSSFWFLFTDGDILDREVRTFAKGLVEYGLHGLASVVAIFGEQELPPSQTNVSVGLSVFAVSPHCAFLYTHVSTGITYILQTKGCFSALLTKGAKNPRLDANTRWEDLPRTSYENLSRVPVPAAQSVAKDEIILADSTRINLSKVFDDPEVDLEIAGRLLDDEDNLKTISLLARLKGQSQQLRKWLDRVENASLETAINPKKKAPEGDNSLLDEIVDKLVAKEDPNELRGLQKQLRTHNSYAHHAPPQAPRRERFETSPRMESISYAYRTSESTSYQIGDSLGSHYVGVIMNYDVGAVVPVGSLKNPGFHKPDSPKDYFADICIVCGKGSSVMALILREPPEKSTTMYFPAPGSLSTLVYPLTMGNYPETDIVSSCVACDTCAYDLRRKKMAFGDVVTAALPLVSFSTNRDAWLQTLDKATQKRFAQNDLPLVFLGILYAKLERLSEEEPNEVTEGIKAAMSWACENLLQQYCPEPHPPYPLPPNPLGNVLLQLFQNSLDDLTFIKLISYPLDGFVAANLALSNSDFKTSISIRKRERIVFLRFLYHLTEEYCKILCESGEMVAQAARMLLLLDDDDDGGKKNEKSLLRLDNLLRFSQSFGSSQEMIQFFYNNHAGKRRQSLRSRKLSVSVHELIGTALLDKQALYHFKRLGSLFTWIQSTPGHVIATFLHYIFYMEDDTRVASDRFVAIRNSIGMENAISNPENLNAVDVQSLIRDLDFSRDFSQYTPDSTTIGSRTIVNFDQMSIRSGLDVD